jgi:hypothetical protein
MRFDHEGRRLVSRRMATELTGRDPSVIHRAAEPVACDVETRVLLIVVEELKVALPKPRRTVD